jgi:surface polysaccharide O-acyltransferase-like enzyme
VFLLVAALPLFSCLLMFGGALHGDTSRYGGGYNLVSLGKSAWESLVCVGAGLLLVTVFRECFPRQGTLGRILADNAFAVYVFHPPVIILLAILLHPVYAPPIVKAVVLTSSAVLLAFSLSALILRRIPLLRAIL